MEYAPIAVFAYRRLGHLRQALDALFKNPEIKRSKLFIFSDGPKNEKQVDEIGLVRAYVSCLDHPELKIISSERNKGLSNSIISGVSSILSKHETVIVVEDDLVVAPNFLDFMNRSLDRYAPNKSILSVSGFSYPVAYPKDFSQDVILTQRFSAWGWGTWKSAWDNTDWEMKNYQSYARSWRQISKFSKISPDLPWMLHQQISGQIDSWAIRWLFKHFVKDAFCLMPTRTLVKNIGLDGSGTHGDSLTEDSMLRQDLKPFMNIELPDFPIFDRMIAEHIRKLHAPESFIGKAKSFLKRLFLRKGGKSLVFAEKFSNSIRKR
ncbi:MAG: glycosyltransferase [Deltaproteobacteria bacterium]|nr:glycosyltransferase [Deltaproteobacteria bacterium]